MRGGRGAGRILLAIALVALPLVGFALLATPSTTRVAGPRDAVLRLLAGQASDAQAVRPASDADLGGRGAPGARELGLLAVLLGGGALAALAGAGAAPRLVVATPATGRFVLATGRGPPQLPR
jgi:hypothetical protein